MPLLVQNVIEEEVPGGGYVRLGINLGAIQEILDGDLIASCVVAITSSPAGSPALAIRSSSTRVDYGYMASAEFTGGKAGTYVITFTPTLVSGQTLPPRTCTLVLS